MPPLPRRTLLLTVLAVTLVVTWPLAVRPLHLLANPLGEGNNHHWMAWRAWWSLFHSGPAANVPVGIDIPLMDPVNAPWWSLAGWLDPALGFNGIVVANLLLAFAGAYALARALGATPRGALVAGVVAEAAPFLGGVISFGITESLPVGWIGLHAAALIAWGRTGRHRWWLAAGLSLAAFVFAGWYHAVFGLVVEAVLVPAVLVAARRDGAPLGGRLAGAVAQGALAAALVAPRLLEFLAVSGQWAARFHGPSDMPVPLKGAWRIMPIYGTDLLNFVLPAIERVEVSKSVYLGLLPLALALVAGRRGRLALLVCAPLWLLAMGHWLSIAGHTLALGFPVLLPGGWLARHVTALQGLSHWHRAAGPAVVFFAAAAGLGAERLLTRVPRALPVLLSLIVADSLLLSQTPWPRDTTDPRPPAIYQSLAGAGAVVQLPFDNGRKEFSSSVPRIYNLWQPHIGRPVSENYEGVDALLASNRFVAVADSLCGVELTLPHEQRPPRALRRKEALDGQLTVSVGQLQAAGVRWVALHTDRAETPEAAEAFLRSALGGPVLADGAVLIWEVGRPPSAP